MISNKKLNVDRATLQKFHATSYQIKKDGLAGKQWGKGNDVLMSIEGFANYVVMVSPAEGSDFLNQVKRIRKLYGERQR